MGLLGMFPGALAEVSYVLAHGAVKYGMHNWKHCDDKARYYNALVRHALSYSQEEKDVSGYSHLAHIVSNALMLMELDNEHQA